MTGRKGALPPAYPLLVRTLEVMRNVGLDPHTILRDGITQEGYQKLRPTRDGGDFTPWPTPEIGKLVFDTYTQELAGEKLVRVTLPPVGTPVTINGRKVGEVRSVSFDSLDNAYATVVLDGHDFGTSVSLSISRKELADGDQ